ncbi:MAG: hypothetical protein OXH76_00950 [Boseongicola sp.]|nr:hypothetical protein [Boseongicola sp.]
MTANPTNDSAKASALQGREGYGDWKHEAGQWLGLLRDQWFPRNPYKFNWMVRFIFLYLGAYFYLTAVILLASAPSILQIWGVLTIDVLFLSIIVPAAVLGMLFAGLLCWIDRNADPARLFLSGLAFPAFVVLIIRYSLGREILGVALGIPQGVAVQ